MTRLNVSTTVTHGAASTTVRSVSALEIISTLDYIQLEDDLSVFRLTYSVQSGLDLPKHITERFPDSEAQGFARPEDIDAYLDNEVPALIAVPRMYLAPKGLIEDIQKLGYVDAIEKYTISNTPYDEFMLGEAMVEDVHFLDTSSYTVRHRNGQVLPVGMYFDYTRGRIDNSRYHLKKAIGILENDARVTPVDTGRFATPCDKFKILDIPYYNAEPKCNKHLSFMFSPTQDDMIRMWEYSELTSPEYPSNNLHDAVFDLDILGLRAGGAAKYDDYNKSDLYS